MVVEAQEVEVSLGNQRITGLSLASPASAINVCERVNVEQILLCVLIGAEKLYMNPVHLPFLLNFIYRNIFFLLFSHVLLNRVSNQIEYK